MSDRLQDIEDAIAHELGLSDSYLDGTYLYWLTRVKSAFAIGTMTLDDFEEVDDELLENIFNAIKPYFDKQQSHIDKLTKQNRRYEKGLEFYANRNHYEVEYYTGGGDSDIVVVDYGDVARETLEGDSNG